MNCHKRQFLITSHQAGKQVWAWAALHGTEEQAAEFLVDMSCQSLHHETREPVSNTYDLIN